jgi:hypothetical protein
VQDQRHTPRPTLGGKQELADSRSPCSTRLKVRYVSVHAAPACRDWQALAGAQFNLGIMYAEGKGVRQDHVLAHMWLYLVVSELPPSGKDQRDTTVDALHLVASKMSLAQVAEARQLAFEWMIERRHRAQQNNLAVTLR